MMPAPSVHDRSDARYSCWLSAGTVQARTVTFLRETDGRLKAVLAFRAEDDDEARAITDDEEGSMRSDLKVLVGMDGKPLWDGESAIEVREAIVAQHAEWKQSRDQAISDGEIDLDTGNNPDE
jgi:hypothetical protein